MLYRRTIPPNDFSSSAHIRLGSSASSTGRWLSPASDVRTSPATKCVVVGLFPGNQAQRGESNETVHHQSFSRSGVARSVSLTSQVSVGPSVSRVSSRKSENLAHRYSRSVCAIVAPLIGASSPVAGAKPDYFLRMGRGRLIRGRSTAGDQGFLWVKGEIADRGPSTTHLTAVSGINGNERRPGFDDVTRG